MQKVLFKQIQEVTILSGQISDAWR